MLIYITREENRAPLPVTGELFASNKENPDSIHRLPSSFAVSQYARSFGGCPIADSIGLNGQHS